jgi:hypothetical protein
MLESAAPWLALCEDARRDVAPLLGIVVITMPSLPPFTPFEDKRSVLWFGRQDLDEQTRTTRLLPCRQRDSASPLWPRPGRRGKIFLSHAKADGKLAAEGIVRHTADPTNGLKLNSFYDALELETGEEWRQGLLQGASRASMLSINSSTKSNLKLIVSSVSMSAKACSCLR